MTNTGSGAPARPRKERKTNADKRRRQLLDAARRSIMANGLARTTLATVAGEAGLSQGVAVFYFNSKSGLLTETLRAHYQAYETTWRAALAEAGASPRDQLLALIEADFDEKICNADALSIWFAFWGEQRFTPQYAEISAAFDTDRTAAIREVCARLFTSAPAEETVRIADWIDTLTDGFWQHIHLRPELITREYAVEATKDFVRRMEMLHGEGCGA